MSKFTLTPGKLNIADIKKILAKQTTLQLHNTAKTKIEASAKLVANILTTKKTVYGVNTGFGALATTHIASKDLETLQKRIILSHAAGTGDYVIDEISQLMLLLKINSLARGFSGVRYATIDALIALFNAKIYPCIPAQGSVGASGDLAPLAHMSAILLGIGEARYYGHTISAHEALTIIHQAPLKLASKEGLALLNGTQFSTALALHAIIKLERVFNAAIIAGAMSVEAARGCDTPFDAKIQTARGFPGQTKVAKWLRDLLADSEIRNSHRNCNKVQDPYSLRCQPQVMGAVLTQIEYAFEQIMIEANAVSDNPIIFVREHEILSGGNFHAQPVAFAADALAIAIAEIGSIAERRIALLIDPHFSGLPAFLTPDPGLNSGFMVAQVTAASLVSENKSLAHPASVDSLPTSANQEDHVSMSAYAARRLLTMIDNLTAIVAIELLAASQAIDLLKPLHSSPILRETHNLIRNYVLPYKEDRFFAPDIAKIVKIIQSGEIAKTYKISILDSQKLRLAKAMPA